MFVYSKSILSIMMILHVSRIAHSEGTCADQVQKVMSILANSNNGYPNSDYPRTSNDSSDDPEEKGYGNNSCAQNQNNQQRQKIILGFNCSPGSQLSYVALYLDIIFQGSAIYFCNNFGTTRSNATYLAISGEYCNELNVVANSAFVTIDGKEIYIEWGSLEGTPCEGGTFYTANDLSVNQRGSCKSKEGLKHIESSYAFFVVIGGKCESQCFGKVTLDFCPGSH